MFVIDIIKANATAMERGALPMWTVYDKPTDYPTGYIARRFEVGGAGNRGAILATDDSIVGTIEEIRHTFRLAGLTCLPRDEADEQPIVECWV
jgi:hypothetical protein